MEILLIFGAVWLLFKLFSAVDNIGTPGDNREPYARNDAGQVMALMVRGEPGNVPSHEDYIHDGTAHQNPAVVDSTRLRWFLCFPYATEQQTRYYPLTISEQGAPNLDSIGQRVSDAKRRGVDVDLVTLDRGLERQVIHRETGEQRGRGVPDSKLRKRGE